MKKERNINIDLIKVFAIFSVVCVHFFKNSLLYGRVFSGRRWLVFTCIQCFFLCCVPLFIMCTGFLMKNKKKYDKNYLFGLKKVLIPYLIISVFCVFVRKFYFHDSLTFMQLVLKIFDYTACDYAWYVNMYICLYLLIPFLNKLYSSLDGERERRKLVIVFLVLSTLPTLINIKYKIIPDYFGGMWPIMYYYIGVYISDYDIKLNKLLNVVLVGLFTLLFGFFVFHRSVGSTFSWGSFNYWNGFIPCVIAILMFLLIFHIKHNITSNIIKKLLFSISNLTLSIYLFSYVYDRVVYPAFGKIDLLSLSGFMYFPVVVFLVFIFSYISAIIVDYMYKNILKLCTSIKSLCKR